MERSRDAFLTLIGGALLTASAQGAAAQGPYRKGSELQVNSYTSGAQAASAVAFDHDSGFVVVWESFAQDGDDNGIFARRFDSGGNPVSAEFQVNSYTPGPQRYPTVAMDADGDFVVAWRGSFGQDGSGWGVFARRFDSGGGAQGAELQVNSFTNSFQWFPSIALADDGDFVIVWSSYTQDGGSYGIFARRFDSDGSPLAAELQVNSYTPGAQNRPEVAADADGDFVVAWQSAAQDGSSYGIFARRFDSAGTAQGIELQVSSYTAGIQDRPDLAIAAGVGFVITWSSLNQDGSGNGVFAQRFDAAGTGLGAEFRVSVATLSSQLETAVEMAADGSFVVVWQTPEYLAGYGILGRRFDSAGVGAGSEFRANTYTPSNQRRPAVGMDEEGGFVVAWESIDQDGNGYGVFAQRYGPLATLDVDGDGSVAPLTDGLLVLRYLFGFTGPTLVAGAVDADCTRCEGPAVAAYLAGLGLVLDIDDDDALAALTDGLLVLRYLFGFTGPTLEGGVVDPDCNRCLAAELEGYLATLL